MISDEYREQLVQLHRNKTRWGTTGERFVSEVLRIMREQGHTSVIDFGCGKGELLRLVARQAANDGVEDILTFTNYDPGMEEYQKLPRNAADLLVSTDVLEHIEPEHLEAVLEKMSSLCKREAYLVVHTGPAVHILPDGRNAHLIQQSAKWWKEQIGNHFRYVCPPESIRDDGVTFLIPAFNDEKLYKKKRSEVDFSKGWGA